MTKHRIAPGLAEACKMLLLDDMITQGRYRNSVTGSAGPVGGRAEPKGWYIELDCTGRRHSDKRLCPFLPFIYVSQIGTTLTTLARRVSIDGNGLGVRTSTKSVTMPFCSHKSRPV